MAGFDPILLGTVADDRTGDTFRAGGEKINAQFQELFGVVASIGIQFISQESDFAIQDATTITLEAKTQYIITEAFSTAKSFTVQDAAVLTSSSTLGPLLTYTGTGSMFNITDASFVIRLIQISAPNAQYYNFTDTVGGTFAFLSDNVRHIVGSKYGSFSNPQTVLITVGAAFGLTQGITITGTGVLIVSIDKLFISSTSASFKAVDLNSSVSQTTEFRDLTVDAPAGAFGISGLAASGNIPVGKLAMVNNCEFGGGMTPLENILQNDIRWEFGDNVGIADSRNAADVYLTGGSETITTGSAGDWQEIGIPGGGGVSWASDISDRFTIGTNGVITYVGERDISVRVSGRATVEKVGGGSNVLEVRLALNWNGTVSDSGLEKSRAQTQNTDPTTVPIGALMDLVENDTIRAIFSNITGGSNIIASVSALEVTD